MWAYLYIITQTHTPTIDISILYLLIREIHASICSQAHVLDPAISHAHTH